MCRSMCNKHFRREESKNWKEGKKDPDKADKLWRFKLLSALKVLIRVLSIIGYDKSCYEGNQLLGEANVENTVYTMITPL